MREGIEGGGAPVANAWKMFGEAASTSGAVGPGSRGVSLGASDAVAVVVPGPLTGFSVKPPEGRPVKKLCRPN